ncbi:MAG: hypothetical protein K5640_06505 [Treponema sp.]|nr:hypothetical protein [Treponema sp.]
MMSLFASCSADLEINIDKNGTANVKFNSSMGTALEKLIKSLSESENSEQEKSSDHSIFNEEEIRQSFIILGFKNVNSKVKDLSGIFIDAVLQQESQDVDKKKFLSDAIKISSEKATLTFSPENLKKMLESTGEDFQSYADLFMAPVFTGEAMSIEEYKELLGGVYGNAVAEELTSSNLKITLRLASGKKAVYSVPFAEILTLTGKKEFSVAE